MKGFGMAAAALGGFVLATTVLVTGPGSDRMPPTPAAAASPSRAWTDFTLPDMEGRPVSLSEYVGKKAVLLAFWATWCPHCNEAVPAINRLHGDGATRERLQVLALDFRESRDQVGAFVRSKGVRFPILLDAHGRVAAAYGVVGIPTYVLIGRDGKILYRDHELPADLSRALD